MFSLLQFDSATVYTTITSSQLTFLNTSNEHESYLIITMIYSASFFSAADFS